LEKFVGADFFDVDSLLTHEEIMVRDTIRAFVSEQVIPIIEEYNRESKFPMHLIEKMAELGLFGITLPLEYGCPDLSNVSYGLAMQELERGDSSIRSFASVQSSLVMYPIYTFGSEAQKNFWLPQLASAKKIGCFGLTEPDFGSNPGGMLTKAEVVEGGYLLNGTKMWITNGSIADVAVVWAKLDGKVRGFLVEKGEPGFSTVLMKGKHSLKASVTSELILEDVFVSEDNLLAGTDGLKSALKCLDQARYGIAWGVVGSMMACYDAALNYSKSRIQFDRPIAANQLIQQKLVNFITEISKSQLLNLQLGRLKDKGKLKFSQVSLAKRNNCEKALEIAHQAREILGANGILDEYPVMRHAANLESVKTYEGTHEMHTLIVGEEITGIPAYK
jgi:Acyl-CoA dehydrogenases